MIWYILKEGPEKAGLLTYMVVYTCMISIATLSVWFSILAYSFPSCWPCGGLPLVSMEQIREIRHITSYPTKSEVIDQFNAYVRGPLRDSVVNAMGEENYMSFKLCMVASLPSFLAGLVAVLGCQGHQDCMIGASFEGFTSDWKYMMANAVIYLLLNPVNLSLMFPLNLRINQLVERHVTGRCQILVGSFLSGFTIALLDVVSNTHMALVLLASTQSSWVFSAALVACFILQVSNLWLLFFKRRPHHSNSRVLTLPNTNIAPGRRPSQRKLIFQPQCFRCYVSFREGSSRWTYGAALYVKKRCSEDSRIFIPIEQIVVSNACIMYPSAPTKTWSWIKFGAVLNDGERCVVTK